MPGFRKRLLRQPLLIKVIDVISLCIFIEMMVVDDISLQLNLRVKTNYAPLQLDGMICRSILIEWYQKTENNYFILFPTTISNYKKLDLLELHNNRSLRIWTEFRLIFFRSLDYSLMEKMEACTQYKYKSLSPLFMRIEIVWKLLITIRSKLKLTLVHKNWNVLKLFKSTILSEILFKELNLFGNF